MNYRLSKNSQKKPISQMYYQYLTKLLDKSRGNIKKLELIHHVAGADEAL
jgi:hypothetical protein